MSRLEKRLSRNRGIPLQNLPNYEPVNEYPVEQQPQQMSSALAQEYDRLQKKAQDYQKELVAIEKTNPHTLYREVVTAPSTKGKHPIRIMGRPVDLAKLENYLVYKISPKTVTTLMKYNDARAIEEIKGYSKHRPVKFKSGIIWIIIGAIVILVMGYILMSTDMTVIFRNMFGM